MKKLVKNPRNAGRKPLGIAQTNLKATIDQSLVKEWQGVVNKSEFIRKAIAQRLQSKRVKTTPFVQQEVLIVKVEIDSNGPAYYGSIESGEVFEGCVAYPDSNGDRCLMRLYPIGGDEESAIDYVSYANAYLIRSVWAESEVLRMIREANATFWYIEKPFSDPNG